MAINLILWIDDDLNYALLIDRMLQGEGVPNPLVPLKPRLALAYLADLADSKEHKTFPSVIVIVVRTRAEDSLELFRWLRSRRHFVLVPVLLVLTSDLDTPEAKEFGGSGGCPEALARLAVRLIRCWLQEDFCEHDHFDPPV